MGGGRPGPGRVAPLTLAVARARVTVALLLAGFALLAGACARRHARLPPAEMSGFLDDYALLREGGPGDVRLVYRNPKADWHAYDRVLLEPVTLWRSGKGSLDPVPEADLLRLASDFEAALRVRLGERFRFVDQPGPGVMRIRLGITAARASDPILDVLTATSEAHAGGARDDGPLVPETRQFVEGAAIEGEIRDAATGELLAEGVDRRRRKGGLPIDTWAEIDRAFAFWADRLCSRLEARTGR